MNGSILVKLFLFLLFRLHMSKSFNFKYLAKVKPLFCFVRSKIVTSQIDLSKQDGSF